MTTESKPSFPALRQGIEDPARIFEEMIAAGEEWSDLNAAATLLEDMKKSELAKLTIEYEGALGSARGSKAKAETMALSDDRYYQCLKDASEARRKANRARVKYDQAKTFIELQRSIAATLREELKNLNR